MLYNKNNGKPYNYLWFAVKSIKLIYYLTNIFLDITLSPSVISTI